jgi:KDO2-lipid IV(A) lauroyltransferase
MSTSDKAALRVRLVPPRRGLAERSRVDGDRREGGTWTQAQAAKNALLYALTRGALAACHLLPRSCLRLVGTGLGLVAYALFGEARRVAYANLARVRPQLVGPERGRLLRASYRSLGAHLGDAVSLLMGAPFAALPLELGSRTVMEGALGEGKGVIFPSAHLGPWEWVAGSLVAEGLPLTVLARESYDARLTHLYDRLRSKLGVRAIYRGDPRAALRIVRTLRSGRVLGIPMDLRSRVPSVDVPFLGFSAPTALGPARIALRTRAPVVVGTAAPRVGGTLAVTFTRIPTADLHPGHEGEVALTARINAELSVRILAMPEAWVWMHPRWPQRRSKEDADGLALSEALNPRRDQ